MPTPVNISSLVPYKVFPAKMGGQKAIALFYEYLSRQVPVTILSVKSNELPANYPAHFLPVLPDGKSRYASLSVLKDIKRLMREKQFSHLILEHPYYAWLGYFVKKSTGVKLVVRSHNIEALRFKSIGKWWWFLLWRYERFIHRFADVIFFITQEDLDYAVQNFGVKKDRCSVITYGTAKSEAVSEEARTSARKALQQIHQINSDERILLFNGTLDYKPNLEAIDIILQKIKPLLDQQKEFRYRIIICGKDLPSSYNGLKDFGNRVIYAGFVNDIDLYFNGADVFINPVTTGGGIKTKLVEALAAGLSSVSTKNGAFGVPLSTTGNKMIVTNDDDWTSFANAIISIDTKAAVPAEFFNHFYWENIAEKAAERLSSDI